MSNIKVRFNERELGKRLFELKDDEFRKFVLRMTFYEGDTQGALSFVLKYLLHIEHRNPYELESFIRKYEVVLIYAYLSKSKYINIFDDPGFEDIIEGGITYDKIDHAKFSKRNELVKIFNDLNGDDGYDKLIKNVASILSPYVEEKKKAKVEENAETTEEKEISKKSSLNNKEFESIHNLLCKDKKFFYSYRMRFDNIFESHTRNNDMLVAESLADNEFYDFELEILEEDKENFYSNLIDGLASNDMDKYGPLIFGYMVYIPVLHNDLKLTKPVKLMNSVTLKLHLKNKHCRIKTLDKPSLLRFIDENYRIDKDKIVPFNFTLNGKRYRFSKEGLDLI